MKQIFYGTLITVVANSKGSDRAPYKRFKKGVENVYQVQWQKRQGDVVEARLVKGGRYTNTYYSFPKADVLPVDIANKCLKDYL